MQSLDIPYGKGMNYGIGVNILTGENAGKAVIPGQVTGPTDATGQTVVYNFKRISSLEELYDSIGISVEAGGHYGLFKAGGKFKFADEAKFNSQSDFLVAHCVIENAFTQCEDAQIKPEAGELIIQGKMELFAKRYGSSFVRGMQTGGEFYAIISITSETRQEQKSLSASLQAKYGGLFAAVDFDAKLDNVTKSKIAKNDVQVFTYQKGGQGEETAFTREIEEVMTRLKQFPEIVRKNPVPYLVQLASYETINMPEGPNPIDIQRQKEALEDYARIHLKLLSLRNDVEFIQLHPEYFENPPDVSILNEWNDHFVNQINAVQRQASKCASDPKENARVSLQLPEGFHMSKRKEQGKTGSLPGLGDNTEISLLGDTLRINQSWLPSPIFQGITYATLGSFECPKGIYSSIGFHSQGGFSMALVTDSPVMSLESGAYFAGAVGIGTSEPTHVFHVRAPDAVGLFESTGSTAYLRFTSNEGIDNRVEIANRPGGRLSLWTAGGGDAFNIARTGDVGIGTTNPRKKLEVNGELLVTQHFWVESTDIHLTGRGGGVGNNDHLGRALVDGGPDWGLVVNCANDFGKVFIDGDVNIGGNLVARNIGGPSDARLKTNIKPLANALEKLSQISGVSFEWNGIEAKLGGPVGTRGVGLIAQEVATVFPELVCTWGTANYQAIDYGRLTAILVEAIKELSAKVEALQSPVAR